MFEIRIMEYGKNEPFKVMFAKSERSAEKIQRGANINLNHEQFYIEIKEVN